MLWISYAHGMKKKTILETLNEKACTASTRQVIAIQSVVGTVRISKSDPELATADAAVRAFFAAALNRR
jgi:hypothetical protein